MSAFLFPAPFQRFTLSKTLQNHPTLPRRTSSRIVVCAHSPPSRSKPSIRILIATLAAAAAFNFNFLPPHQFLPDVAHAARGGGASFSSASGDVNKDGESLLRWALPIDNQEVRDLQGELEGITTDLRGFKWGKVSDHVRKVKGIAERKGNSIMKAVNSQHKEEAQRLMSEIKDGLSDIGNAVADKSADKVVERQKDVLRKVGQLEEMMVNRFPYEVPEEYSNLPWLRGRATIEMTVEKAGGAQFDIDGTLYDKGYLTMVVDGYSAPLTAGNFVQLVNRGFYNGKQVIRSDGFVVQTGKPEGKAEGYVDPDLNKVRTVPLEVFAKGDKSPTYGVTLEDDGRGAAATVLPFSSYGTLAFAREEFTPDSGSSQFFWFLFTPDLTPAGRNLLDGRYAVFGYTVDGQKFLTGLEAGDRIVEAKVTAGLENLVEPKVEARTG